MRIKRFFAYGILGWSMEILWTSAWNAIRGDVSLTGVTYAWMFPIYGAAVFLEEIHERIRGWSWYARGAVWVMIIFAIEYFSGWLLRQILGICPWDYSGSRYSVNGLIRLDYAPAWFTAGLVFERIHDYLIVLFPDQDRREGSK